MPAIYRNEEGKEIMADERLYAFWKYDRPPYMLGGEVLKIREDGGVFVKGYDQYMSSYFKKEAIMAIVPYEEGVKLHAKLNNAKRKYDLRIQKAEKDLRSVRDMIASKNVHA